MERAVLQKTVESFFDRDLQSGFSCFGLRRKINCQVVDNCKNGCYITDRTKIP